MARKLFVSVDMGIDEQLARITRIDAIAALIWPWFIPHFDDWGRATASPIRLKGLVFPHNPLVTEDQISTALKLYADEGLIEEYESGGKPYMAVPPDKWFRNQPHLHEWKRTSDKGSKLPQPPSWLAQFVTEDTIAINREESRKVAESRDESRENATSLFLDSGILESEGHKATESPRRARVSQPASAAMAAVAVLPIGLIEEPEEYESLRAQTAVAVAKAVLPETMNSRTLSDLLNRFSHERIIQQAAWLDYRNPKPGKRAATLVAAIRDKDGVGYEPPIEWEISQELARQQAKKQRRIPATPQAPAAPPPPKFDVDAIRNRWEFLPAQKREALDTMAWAAVKRQSNFANKQATKSPNSPTVQKWLWEHRERLMMEHDRHMPATVTQEAA